MAQNRQDESDAFEEAIYSHYVHIGFGERREQSSIGPEMMQRYYARNYGPHLPEDRDSAALEIACGRGGFLDYLREAGYGNVAGLDLSPECVEVCKQSGHSCICGNAFDYLPKHPDSYDAIVCSDLLEHLAPARGWTLARHCREALRDGGVLIIKVPNMAAPLVATRTRYIDPTHQTGYTDASLKMVLRAAGFGRVQAYPVDPYVTDSALLNGMARVSAGCLTLLFRILRRLYGVYSREVMTKSILAVARGEENPA